MGDGGMRDLDEIADLLLPVGHHLLLVVSQRDHENNAKATTVVTDNPSSFVRNDVPEDALMTASPLIND